MSIPGSVNPLFLGAAGQATGGGEYQIERSVRFNSPDSAYLSRTPGSASNRKTWTWAGWVKRSGTGNGSLFTTNGSGDSGLFSFEIDSNNLRLAGQFTQWLRTSAVFRDFSAWYHIVLATDTTQATASDRFKIYVNGAQITAFAATSYPSQNADLGVNSTILHHIGSYWNTTPDFNGLLADIHFIDGQALTPSSFGEFDTNGVWQPIDASGLTFGTNGFHLPFSDNSTAAALGTDSSGAGNTWTVNNISVTAGAGNDSLVDTPTNGSQEDTGVGGEVVGNYCTLNPLENQLNLTNGNLDVDRSTATWASCKATVGLASGKWYYEYTVNSGSSNQIIGVYQASAALPAVGGFGYMTVSASGWGYQLDGNKSNNNIFTATGTTASAGDVLMVAFDVDAGKIWFGKNGTWIGSGAPASGTNAAFTNLSGTVSPAVGLYGSQSGSVNFGARPFAYTAPSGFKALCTTNLPEPTIADGSTAMDVALYTGNGSTQTISGLNFSPDLVWIKARGRTWYHNLFDVIRGTGKGLSTNTTDAERTLSNDLTTFNSDGFSLSSGLDTNESGSAYVAWTWDAGSSTVTNTEGSITSQVRANASAGFSVVKYTNVASTNSTIGHGLGVAPKLVIVRYINNTSGWYTYHADTGAGKYLELQSTNSATTLSSMWNNTAPTSTVFSVGTAWNITVDNIAYCFAPVAGYSSFGSFVGNASADGPFVYTGMRPRWVLWKKTSTTSFPQWWALVDSSRVGYNSANNRIWPNVTNAESSDFEVVDFLSNGFKIRTADSSYENENGATYIYAAFAENPFQYSRAR